MKMDFVFLLKVLGSIALLALVAVFLWQFPEGSAEWAAWVQAFGAIAAILAAAAIASRQSDQVRREEADRRIAHLKGVRGLFDDVNNTLTVTLANLQERGGQELLIYVKQRTPPIRIALEAIRRIPFHEVPLVYLGGVGLNYVNMFTFVVQAMEDMAIETWQVDDSQQNARLDRGVDRIAQCVSRAGESLKTIRNIVSDYDGIRSPRITASDLL
jgi:hypothetical protein